RADESASLRPAILDAIEEANRAVIDLARGAATTLVVAEIVARRLRSYHVGDSELFAVGQRGRIKRRVVPHSPTGFAVEAGLMDEDEAVQHDQRHVLFNAIGAEDMRVEIGGARKLGAPGHGAAGDRWVARQSLRRRDRRHHSLWAVGGGCRPARGRSAGTHALQRLGEAEQAGRPDDHLISPAPAENSTAEGDA